MAWVTSYSGNSTINLGPHQYGDEVMFHLKELLKSVGWSVLSSSDGTTYNSSGDQISHSGSGANGYGNTSAWFRIQDPGALREYVFQRGSSSLYLKWMYSASDKFTGGTPNATTPPTATDEQGLARAVTTSQVMFPGTAFTHIAAQSSAHNGVYAWWLVRAETLAVTPERTIMMCDAMDASFSSGDNDPCVHIGTEDAPTYATIGATSLSANPDSFRSWMRYGETDEEWSGITGLYYTANGIILHPYIGVPNPHTGKYPLLPIHFMRHSSTGTLTGYKGMTKFTKWRANSSLEYPLIQAETSDNYLIWKDICLPGVPAGVTLL